MKEQARLQPGMSFYGELPDTYSLVLNTDHPLVRGVNDGLNAATAERLAPIDAELADSMRACKPSKQHNSTPSPKTSPRKRRTNSKR